jgi:ribonuclease HII
VFGVDEVGRGPLAGPVTACAFVVRKPFELGAEPPLPPRDSKRLSPLQRQKLARWIERNPCFAHATHSVPAPVIDKVNIRQATFTAMRQAIKKLERKTGIRDFVVFVDGRDAIPDLRRTQYPIIKGDAQVFSIACASIVAKVHRDRYVSRTLALKFPEYRFEQHKGYGTALHYRLIKKHGISAMHRKTFLKNLPTKKKVSTIKSLPS